MKKILIFSEAASLAHVIRPLALLEQIDQNEFEVIVAISTNYFWLAKKNASKLIPLKSQSPEHYESKLKKGDALFSEKVIKEYVEEDLKIIKEHKPDLVISDFRLSLKISCELLKIPYVNINDAHWYPTNENIKYPMPTLPITHWLPIPLSQLFFNILSPFFIQTHINPYLKVRTFYNLANEEINLKDFYCKSDLTFFSSYKILYEHMTFDDKCLFVGYLPIDFPVELPPWWNESMEKIKNQKSVYLTMGSTGSVKDIEILIQSLLELEVIVFVSTANRMTIKQTHPLLYTHNYLPGDLLVKHIDLMICHGGTMTAQQALSQGVPVLAIPHNMDQYFFSERIRSFKAGEIIRSDRISRNKIQEKVTMILNDKNYKTQALKIKEEALLYKKEININEYLKKLINKK